MKKILIFVLITCLGLSLIACRISVEESTDTSESIEKNEISEGQETINAENTISDATIPGTEPIIKFFESDAIVNDFFAKYNAVATYVIEAELIKKGNIKTKALVYADSYNLEVININDGILSISIETKPEEEDTVMFAVFMDCIKATTTLSDDEIASSWSAIHETGYMVEDYDINGILITYVPSKELSWGVNNPRVDLTIPVE